MDRSRDQAVALVATIIASMATLSIRIKVVAAVDADRHRIRITAEGLPTTETVATGTVATGRVATTVLKGDKSNRRSVYFCLYLTTETH